MVLWFAGCSIVIVRAVFRDPRIDYRLVALGALLPDLVDVFLGGARYAHTLVASVGLLAVVMLATRRGRPARRRFLALPIGTLCHLVLDGVWTRRHLFWWPLFGSRLAGRLPSLDRPIWLIAIQEVAGAVALLWFVTQ